jgi:L-ascorbate metabolism protein UlaG (beta-lactamase superfamily)
VVGVVLDNGFLDGYLLAVDVLMDRRMFLRNLVDFTQKAAVLNLRMGCSNVQTSPSQGAEDGPPSQFKDTSMRELARRKMHHGNGRYINPFTSKKHGNMLRVLHWKLFSKNHFRSYYDEEPIVPVSIDWEPIRDNGTLSITFLKHASVVIKDQDQYIFVDPVFSEIFSFIKDFTPLAFDLDEMPPPDHVLITHGHYDHIDTTSLTSLNGNTHVISPLGYDDIFADLKMNNRTQLDWFETYENANREITLLPCDHWTMRNPIEGPNTSLWGSYLLKTASGHTIYLSGDTAYFNRLQEIGQEFPIDLAIINLGAYEPRWFMAGSHMNPAETVRAFRDLGAKKLLIVHWGTFRLGDEPVHFPPIDLRKEMEKEGILDRLVHLNHGETVFL